MKRRISALVWLAIAGAGSLPAGTCMGCPGVFGMIGVALGQTLRLGVAAPPGVTCSASLGFVDQHGLPVGPPTKTVTLGSGQTAFLDLNANTVLSAFGSRLEVRPVVTPLAGPVPSFCQSTAEVFDNLSRIGQVLLPIGPPQLPIGPPNVPLGVMGLTRAQVVRLSVANPALPIGPPSTPCAVQLGFLDTNGLPIGPPVKSAVLNRGEASSLDLTGESVVGNFFTRVEVQPAISVASIPGVAACAGVAASAEGFDAFSGRTWTRLMPGEQMQ
jgi:hypothetical protein